MFAYNNRITQLQIIITVSTGEEVIEVSGVKAKLSHSHF